MRIRDPIRWAMVLDANPLPEGCGANPAAWPLWRETATADDRDALYGAMVVIMAERWADAIEDMIEGAATVQWIEFDLAGVALGMLEWIKFEFGTFAPSTFQVGVALEILGDVWAHGPELRSALDRRYLAHVPVHGRPS